MSETTERTVPQVSWGHDLDERVSCLAWSPDGFLLAVGTLGGEAVIFSHSGTFVGAPVVNGLGVVSLAWSPDGAHLAAGGQDGVVTLWDRRQRRCRTLAHRNWVQALAWSKPPTALAVGAGADVALYRPDGTLTTELPFQPSTVTALAWAGSTPSLAVGCRGGIRWFVPPAAEPSATFSSNGAPLAVAVHPGGALLASADLSGSLHLWWIERGDHIEVRGWPGPIELLAWDGAGEHLAVASDDEVAVWPLSSDREELGLAPSPTVLSGRHQCHIADLAYCPGGTLLATAGADGRLVLWDPGVTPDPVGEVDLAGELSRCAWRPGTGTIVVGTAEGGLVATELSPEEHA